MPPPLCGDTGAAEEDSGTADEERSLTGPEAGTPPESVDTGGADGPVAFGCARCATEPSPTSGETGTPLEGGGAIALVFREAGSSARCAADAARARTRVDAGTPWRVRPHADAGRAGGWTGGVEPEATAAAETAGGDDDDDEGANEVPTRIRVIERVVASIAPPFFAPPASLPAAPPTPVAPPLVSALPARTAVASASLV